MLNPSTHADPTTDNDTTTLHTGCDNGADQLIMASMCANNAVCLWYVTSSSASPVDTGINTVSTQQGCRKEFVQIAGSTVYVVSTYIYIVQKFSGLNVRIPPRGPCSLRLVHRFQRRRMAQHRRLTLQALGHCWRAKHALRWHAQGWRGGGCSMYMPSLGVDQLCPSIGRLSAEGPMPGGGAWALCTSSRQNCVSASAAQKL